MSSASLILLAMFTTANVAGPGGQHVDAALSLSMLLFLVISALLASVAAYSTMPRSRRSFEVAKPARRAAPSLRRPVRR